MHAYPDVLKKVQINIPFRWLWEGYLERFLQEGFRPEIGIDAQALETFSRENFAMIASRFREHNLPVTLHAPFMDLSPGSPDPAILAVTHRRQEQILELIPLFEPLTVVCHAGFDPRRHNYPDSNWYDVAAETFNRLGRDMDARGTRMMLENVYEQTPDELLELLTRLKAPVGVCLDVGHLTALGGSHTRPWVEALEPWIGQFHLHDNQGEIDDHHGMGLGRVDFEPVLELLRGRGAESLVITLEPHREEDLWPSLAFLSKNLGW